MVPNPNWVPPSAMPSADAVTTSTERAVGDSSNASEQDVLQSPPVIWLRIWPDGMQLFAPNSNARTHEIPEVIKSMYDQPWLTYMQILAETKESWT
ncbi:uncharacterized protein DS421_3g70260 [Arachis hypogaea]|nr:uncharacterized protein DS421_3g70260 [Arachis hypogaea]